MRQNSKMRKIMIIDGQNLFMRNYVMCPAINAKNGQPYGAVFGFLQSLQKLIREMKPHSIHVAWDGGSDKRKQIDSNYKANREEVKTLNLNRKFSLLTPEEERENRHWQWAQLLESYLNKMPIVQHWFVDVEADDIIAYLAKHSKLQNEMKVIISNDKDFLQLAEKKVVLYSPIRKKFYNKEAVIQEFSISPTNFALARAIVGDPSDNLPGVPRVGLKTIAKRLPFLKENKKTTIDDVINFCWTQSGKVKMFRNVIEHEELIKTNYKLMELYKTSLTKEEQEKVDDSLVNFIPEFKETDICLSFKRDGIEEQRFTTLFAHFRGMLLDG